VRKEQAVRDWFLKLFEIKQPSTAAHFICDGNSHAVRTIKQAIDRNNQSNQAQTMDEAPNTPEWRGCKSQIGP
jgi:hypothetical protein